MSPKRPKTRVQTEQDHTNTLDAPVKIMLEKYNKMHVNAHGCTRMHMKNAYGKKLHHFGGKTRKLHSTRWCTEYREHES